MEHSIYLFVFFFYHFDLYASIAKLVVSPIYIFSPGILQQLFKFWTVIWLERCAFFPSKYKQYAQYKSMSVWKVVSIILYIICILLSIDHIIWWLYVKKKHNIYVFCHSDTLYNVLYIKSFGNGLSINWWLQQRKKMCSIINIILNRVIHVLPLAAVYDACRTTCIIILYSIMYVTGFINLCKI